MHKLDNPAWRTIRRTVTVALTTALALFPLGAQAARCQGKDGNWYPYSHPACSGGGAETYAQPPTADSYGAWGSGRSHPSRNSGGQNAYDPTTDPYSVVNQATHLDEQKRLEQQRQVQARQNRQRRADSWSTQSKLTELRDKLDRLHRELRSADEFSQKFAITSEIKSIRQEIARLSGERLPPTQEPSHAQSGLRSAIPATPPINPGAVNVHTGEFLAPSGSGYVGTRDGTYYSPAGPNGVVNTRTGEFVPMH